MTEKSYGGNDGIPKAKPIVKQEKTAPKIKKQKKDKKKTTSNNEMVNVNEKKAIRAGKILKEVKEYAKGFIVKDMPLLEIAEKIENKIIDLGGEPAFPTNLSMNEIAAHYTPIPNDGTLAKGLLKIDIGVHIDGWTADSAFSLDLEGKEENKKLIEAAEAGLAAAIKIINKDTPLNKIGEAIENAINEKGFNPIINLSGHGMDKYDLHCDITIPNFNDGRTAPIGTGLRAIEPFATSGNGKVHDGAKSTIYALINPKNTRSPIARQVLEFIAENYYTLPFCARWIVDEFGSKGMLGLRELERNGNLHHFDQLVETSGGVVAQAEHTLIIKDNKVIITT